MLRVDLEAASVPYLDDAGRVADFHALRHSYISLLTQQGVHPKLAQGLARHSDIRLTMQAYTHVQLHDLSGAVQNLPALLPSTPQILAATGTEAFAPRPGRDQTAANRCYFARPIENPPAIECNMTGHRNSLKLQAVEGGCEAVSASERERPLPDSNRGMADLQSAGWTPQRAAP
jgi:hypothetical protein